MLSVFINSLKALHISLEKSNIYKLLLVGIISLVLFSSIFYFFEKPVNTDLSYGDALWWGFVTSTTVGYGDYFPITFWGRITGIFLMLIGISTFGFITAYIASVFVENKLKEGMGLMDIKFKNHIVILGWNNKSKIILEELIQDNPEAKIVIVDEIDKLKFEHKNAFFVHGDPTKDETLIRANIPHAQTAIVLANEKMASDGIADAKSVLVCLAMDKLNPKLHIISEVLNEENVPHFKRANVNDIIISSQMSSRIIVRSALSKNISSFIKELLTNKYGNEIYERKVIEEDVGVTFKDLVYSYLEKYNAIVLGIANDEIILNPHKDRIIQSNDVIIYISNEKL